MALNYATCAKEIYETLGGRENLVSAAHCSTRLRLVTVDNSKVDMNALENIDGVKGVFESNGQLQLIIGTGTVNKVYDEFLAVSGMSAATKDEVKAGQKIMTFSLDRIKAAGFSTTTAVLLTNSDDYDAFKIVRAGAVNAGDTIITV